MKHLVLFQMQKNTFYSYLLGQNTFTKTDTLISQPEITPTLSNVGCLMTKYNPCCTVDAKRLKVLALHFQQLSQTELNQI